MIRNPNTTEHADRPDSNIRRLFGVSLASVLFAASLLLTPSCASSTSLYLDENGERSGRLVMERRCIKCHGLFSAKSFTDTEWVGIIESMADEAHLDAIDADLVLRFVQANN